MEGFEYWTYQVAVFLIIGMNMYTVFQDWQSLVVQRTYGI